MVTPDALPVMLRFVVDAAALAALAMDTEVVVAPAAIVPPVMVTPVGAPVPAIVTAPVNPPPRTIVAVTVAVAPATIDVLAGSTVSVTVGVGGGFWLPPPPSGPVESLPPLHAAIRTAIAMSRE
jgi:hypothetical protein